ncbi:transcriptional regulator FtrA [Phytobacter diazotrophicus]|jgi:AraC family transcriptional activator FtrA|uniref:Transcriptional regulator FtrA n=1 Tax=Phytobacter diazotrophicus TaxID=395631 RepID=A0ABN6LPE5_9ENTR|nr:MULTISPECIES: transcriptional regulator FtrA [Phytobacter]AUU91170.1 transcriptional regulator FtrA [Enterobacteriaceae bacterium ENNIH3]AUV08812.1 transcriptional regulator FtrA [Enterobacteriaceae bacterium ENNIH2]MBS6739941.1 transcriptional regulator FtrA [Enterobacteriaceae bacterium]MDU4241286.1 transcriptional regulator FtrA [Bifidobacterium longum]PTA97071.1 transcriptional regulator FtrA [Kluyvera sp. Nf5]QIH63476.1 transcriptional regulator FtrA [Enterobacteriaceae bacterium A-F1
MPDNRKNMTISLPHEHQHLVVALAYDGLCTFEFGVAVEIFGLPRPELGENWYRFAVAAVDEGELRATGGIRIVTEGGVELLEQADTIIVPGWRGAQMPVPETLCQALRQAHQRGCRIMSICSGVFVLAAAGLLNGRKATTHWRYTDLLRQRYPAIEVLEDALYYDEGRVMTSAGSAAGIDLCLHVVRTDFGRDIANNVAQRLVVQPHRDGTQTQKVTAPVARSRESQSLGKLFDFVHQQLAASHTVESLARHVGMSPRTFLRRFAESTGTTPARWILQARLRRAEELLTQSRMNIDVIAEQIGFSNGAALRHHFQQHYALTPGQFRKKFTLVNK